jgi:hypothetical protein
MPRVNLDRAPTSLAALNGLLARTGYDLQVVRGQGYYYVTSDCDMTFAVLSLGRGEQGLYGLGPYLNRHSARVWVEAVADKFNHEEGRVVRNALLALAA